MPVDCFITTHKGRSVEREYFLALTQLALHSSGFDATVVEKPMLQRYYECEYLADSSIYILSDDDVIPATPQTLKELVKIMKDHPDYSQLGLSWKQDMKSEENSSWILNKGKVIWEMDHVGGIMAIRKGTIKNLGYRAEYPSGYGDDRVMGKTARELGFKVGIIPHLYFHHLGAKFTTFNGG